MNRPILAFYDEERAAAIAKELGDQGIICELGSSSDSVKSVHTISVDEPDCGRAIEIAESSEGIDAAIRCPGCDSLRVEFPAKPRASTLISALNAVADAVVPAKEKSFYCDRCTNHW